MTSDVDRLQKWVLALAVTLEDYLKANHPASQRSSAKAARDMLARLKASGDLG